MFMATDGTQVGEVLEEDYDAFYQDVFMKASALGELQEIIVCENKTDHLNGNVYIRFTTTDEGRKARDYFNTIWYDKRPLYCDLCHVVSFQDAICRAHQHNSCDRGEQCNFIHERKTNPDLIEGLLLSQWKSKHINN